MSELPPFNASTATSRRRSGLFLAGAFLVTAVFFWPTLASFPDTWGRYGMSHGWIVAALVGWIAWRDRDRLLGSAPGDPVLIAPLIAASLLWFAATVAYIEVGHQAAFILILAGWGVLVFGRRGLRTVIAAAATFALALPLWDGLIPILRPLTSLVSGTLVRMVGVPADIEGDIIRITAGTFIVADGCAGLNYFRAAVVIAVLYAHILVRDWRAQLGVVALAAAISILGNWIRVTTLIVIGHITSMQATIVHEHIGFGWVVFTVGLVPFFLLAGRVERWIAGDGSGNVAAAEASAADLSASDGTAPDAAPSAESSEPAPAPAPVAGSERRLPRGLVPASLCAIVGPLLYFGVGALPDSDAEWPGWDAWVDEAGWTLGDDPADRPFDWRPAFQGAGEHMEVSFAGGPLPVHGDRFVYREQAQGAKLIGYPNRIAPGEEVLDERLVGPVDARGSHWVRQAIIRNDDGPLLTWYWYRVGGIDAASAVQAKILEIPAFFSRRTTAELIALSAPCEPESCDGAYRALSSLMGVEQAPPAPVVEPEPGGGETTQAPEPQP